MQINKISNTNYKLKQPSFTSAANVLHKTMDKASDVFAKGIEKTAQKAPIEKFITYMTENNKSGLLRKGAIIAVSTVLNTFYVIRTLGNKNIDNKNKKSLAINQTITWVLPTTGALLLDDKITKIFNAIGNKFETANADKTAFANWAKKSFPANEIADEAKILDKFSSLKRGIVRNAGLALCFAFMYRYFTPVIATPLTGMITKKIQAKKDKEAQTAQQTQPAAAPTVEQNIKKA